MDMFMDVFGELLLMGLLIMVMNTDQVVRFVETMAIILERKFG